jgi:hypothetical protein
MSNTYPGPTSLSQGPHILGQCTAVNIMLQFTTFKAGARKSCCDSQTYIAHGMAHQKFCELNELMGSDKQQLPDKITTLYLAIMGQCLTDTTGILEL